MLRIYWSRHWRILLFIAGIALVFLLIYLFSSVVIPYLIGWILAYLLLPPILWIERKLPKDGRWLVAKRVSFIVVLYLLFFGAVALVLFLVITWLIHSFGDIWNALPQYINDSIQRLQDWTDGWRANVPPQMRDRIDMYVQNASVAVLDALQNAVLGAFSIITSNLTMILGFISLPIFLYYVLKDAENLEKDFYKAFSTWQAAHIKNVLNIIEEVVGRYIRAQIVMGLIVGVMDFIGLMIIGIPFAPVLAAFAAFTEFIPMIGPWAAGIAGVIVALATVPEKAIWVAILFASVQMFENLFLVARIQGGFFKIHPALSLILLALGSYIAGIWGVIIILPLTNLIIQLYKYLSFAAKVEQMPKPEMSEPKV